MSCHFAGDAARMPLGAGYSAGPHSILLDQLSAPRTSRRPMRTSVNLIAWLLRYPSRRVPRILMYHRFGDDASSVDPQAFERQLRYLKEHCNVVHMSQLVAGLFGTARLPANAVVMTVDDGYADFHRVAFPLLCR